MKMCRDPSKYIIQQKKKFCKTSSVDVIYSLQHISYKIKSKQVEGDHNI